jgi:hypothetical protein
MSQNTGNHTLHRFFSTKKEIAHADSESKLKRKRETEIKKAKKDLEKAKREAKELSEKKSDTIALNSTYRMVRYWIAFDGNMKEYCRNYINPYTRYHRIMFLENEITKHSPEKQEFINNILSANTKIP